ncbi:MAG: hypothetical protein WCL44_05225 [bacterium]
MKDEKTAGSLEIKDTDIVFECPHCGKSLAIDYHAAGLSIPCTDCGKLVVVPIPDGMEISDLDSSMEDQGALIIHLREVVLDSQTRTKLLEAMVEDFKKRRQAEERKDAEVTRKFQQFERDLESVSRAIDQINTALGSMSDTIRERLRPSQ